MTSARFSASVTNLAAGSMFTHVTLDASIPWSFANAGKSWRWASPGGAASVLPSRSFGVTMPLDFHIHMLSGVLSKTAPTIFTLAPCATLGMTTAASARPMSARPVSTLAIESPEPFESATKYAAWSPTANQFRAKVTRCVDCAPGTPSVAARIRNATSVASATRLIVSPSRRIRPGGPPARRQPDRAVEHQPDDRDPAERRKRDGRVQVRLGSHDDHAEAGLGGDELADDGPDDGRRRRDLERGEHVRQRVRQPDLHEDLPLRRSEDAAEVEQLLVDLREADGGVDHDGEEADQRRDEHVGHDAVAEPEQEERRDRDLRERVDHHEERHERARRGARPRDRHAQRHATRPREREAAEDLERRDPDMRVPRDREVQRGADDRHRTGSRYSRIRRSGGTTCQIRSSAPNSTSEGT